ncbi:MAG: hypothetical protein R6V54_15235 [Desulfobacteraceae bacterium]
MTISDFANELNVDISSVSFWLTRFADYLPGMVDKEKELYKKETLTDLLFIAEKIQAGELPSKIASQLHKKQMESTNQPPSLEEAGEPPLAFLAPFLEKIAGQQERIASAHEKRAESESRKASAIEKRAEAESKKAAAMNNIANALQHMKHEVFPGSPAGNLINHAAEAVALDQDTGTGEAFQETDDTETVAMDDLSLLVDSQAPAPEQKQEAGPPDVPAAAMDDLSLLVDSQSPGPEQKQEPGPSDAPAAAMDDLSLLVEKKRPDLNTSVTLEEDFKKYKSEIINIIIKLKKEGFTIDETTALFNDEEIKPLSGKSRWSSKAIGQIYKFIDSVSAKS